MKNSRIYIFVPLYLTVSSQHPHYYKMPAGRMGAQCAHAVAKLIDRGYKGVGNMITLVMEVEDSKALRKKRDHLRRHGIEFVNQFDTLPGMRGKWLQAVITAPISKEKSVVLNGCTLWAGY